MVRFDGVDYNCTVLLDGELVGNHVGSFLPFEMVLPPPVHTSPRVLEVVINPPPAELIGPLYNGTTPIYGVDQCLENRLFPFWKSRLNLWDFAPKMWQAGIWRNVSLLIRPRQMPRLAQLPFWIETKTVPPYDSRQPAELNMSAELHGGGGAVVEARWSVSCESDQSAPGLNLSTRHGSNTTTIGASGVLPEARLWWPNGYGEQHLYRLRVELWVSGQLVDAGEVAFGVRELSLIHI
eukprot:TRINITY_DN22117_c0_g1_i1.p1 TRINITY_DN22117_c0_g1~~TRINITY_DN22117_c0_g1_i1.p1  ORF type:complete len:237 (+),score=52.83 TRINITY_DN22117_c0_g1_i1:213-923(+)